MAVIGTISRALLESASAYYVGGVPITVLDALGNVVIGDTPPAPPEIVSTIQDRVYAVGSGPYTIDLGDKFSGAAQFVVTPSSPNLSLSGRTLTITPSVTMAQTTISVIGRNGGGDSPALTFGLTVNAATPIAIVPLPDQSLPLGGPNVTLDLGMYFSGVATYAISPPGQGATLSGRTLVLSAAQARSLEVTVTGMNATGQAVSDTFVFAVQAVTQSPAVRDNPSITGGTRAGTTLGRVAGTATGIPAPNRRTVWLLDGAVLPVETGNTLSTAGFAVGSVVTTQDIWENAHGTATGTSNSVTLTETAEPVFERTQDGLVVTNFNDLGEFPEFNFVRTADKIIVEYV